MNYLHSYREELFALGYATKTGQGKIKCIQNFLFFTRKQETQIQTQDLKNYVQQMETKGLRSVSIQAYLIHLKFYFIYLHKNQFIKNNPFQSFLYHHKKQPAKVRNVLTQQQIQQLYFKTHTLKEKIILHLCYGCGLRALELECINIKDLDLKHQIITVQKGKNATRRLVPFNTVLQKDFIKYLQIRNRIKTTEKALLLNERGTRMKKYTANQNLKTLLKRAGIQQEITLHSLRHSIATHLLENGLSLEKVSHFLGHKQLETTEIYTRISTQQLKNL